MADSSPKPLDSDEPAPKAEPAVRTIAMPADTNPHGDIFGGWLLCQMDLAGGTIATRRARGRVVTVAITSMEFHRPVMVGDEVSCFCNIERVGNTSITIKIESWVRRGWGRANKSDRGHIHLRRRRCQWATNSCTSGRRNLNARPRANLPSQPPYREECPVDPRLTGDSRTRRRASV